MRHIIKLKKTNLNFIDKVLIFALISSMIRIFIPEGIRQPFYIYKAIAMGGMFVYLILKKTNIKKILPILLFSIVITLSSIYNKRNIENIFVCLTDSFLYINMFLSIGYFLEKYSLLEIVKYIKKILLIYLIFGDITTFFIKISNNAFYLIGTKFLLSYAHIFYLSLMFMELELIDDLKLKKYIKRKMFYFLIYSILIIIRIGCSTGFVGILMYYIFMKFFERKSKIIPAKSIILSIITIFLIFSNLKNILNIKLIQDFIVNFLNEDLTLTGRMYIYENLDKIVSNSFLLGYGYETQIVIDVVGYGNPQNGIYQLLINYGFIGFCSFILSILLSTFRMTKDDNKFMKPIILFLIVLSVISLVEISFNGYFILSLAIIYCYKCSRKKDII